MTDPDQKENVMRLLPGDVNIYYMHDTLTPGNVRAASYGTQNSSGALVPEVGDILHDFPGWTGTKGEPITVRVVEVKQIGDVFVAYEVHTTTVVDAGRNGAAGPSDDEVRAAWAVLTGRQLVGIGWQGMEPVATVAITGLLRILPQAQTAG